MIDLHQLEDNQYREQLNNKFGDEKYRRAVIEQLLDEYQNGIFKFCVSWLGNEYGEDVAQEVFISAWEKLPNYRGDSSISTWLFGIAKNACRKYWRDQGRHRTIIDDSPDEIRKNVHGVEPVSPEGQQESEEGQTENLEIIAKLRGCINKLPNEEGHLVRLRYIKEKPVAEISEFLDEKPDTLYKRCRRALKKLEQCMKNES